MDIDFITFVNLHTFESKMSHSTQDLECCTGKFKHYYICGSTDGQATL